MRPPKNAKELEIWRRLVSDRLSGVVYLTQHETADLPTLKSTDRAIAWDKTIGTMVTWNGANWS